MWDSSSATTAAHALGALGALCKAAHLNTYLSQKPLMSASDMHPPVSPDFDAAELYRKMPLVDVDVLRPGDVLLLRGRKPHSKAIAKRTGGRFSHAAIWMPTGEKQITAFLLAEADSAGVGFTPLLPIGIQYAPDRGASLKPMRSVYSIPGKATEYVLLRHPGMAGVTWERLNHASEAIQRAVFYRTYSAYPRLLEAVNLSASAAMLAKAFAKLAERARRDTGPRGAFCSELVAMYFAQLNLELFSLEKRPEQVSPNDLCSDSCYLEVVENAFLSVDDLVGAIGGYGGNDLNPRKSESFKALVENTTGVDRFIEQAEDFRAYVDQTSKKVSESFLLHLEKVDHQFRARIAHSAAVGDDERADKLRRHMLMARYGRHLITITDNRTAVLRMGGFSDAEIRSWNDASFILQRMAHQLTSTAVDALSRDQILFSIRSARKLKRAGTLSRRESIRFVRIRRQTLQKWREQKNSTFQSLKFTNDLLKVDNVSEDSRAHIDSALHESCNAVLADFDADDAVEEQEVLR